jgi:hypothetical protein
VQNFLNLYNDLANQVWRRMVGLVGDHTVNILIQRAAWEAKQKFDEALLIEYDDAGISFAKLGGVEPVRAKAVVEEFFGSLASILTRLVGKEITRKLIEEIDGLIGTEE